MASVINPSVSTLDETDQAIIHAYWMHPKAGYAAIARDVGTSEATVRRRVRALVAADVLEFTVVLGPPARSGYLELIIGVAADGHRVDRIVEELARHPRIRFLATALGSFDILLAASVATIDDWKELRSLVAQIDGVTRTETFLLTDVVKRSMDSYTPDQLAALDDVSNSPVDDSVDDAVIDRVLA